MGWVICFFIQMNNKIHYNLNTPPLLVYCEYSVVKKDVKLVVIF